MVLLEVFWGTVRYFQMAAVYAEKRRRIGCTYFAVAPFTTISVTSICWESTIMLKTRTLPTYPPRLPHQNDCTTSNCLPRKPSVADSNCVMPKKVHGLPRSMAVYCWSGYKWITVFHGSLLLKRSNLGCEWITVFHDSFYCRNGATSVANGFTVFHDSFTVETEWLRSRMAH